MPKHMWIAVQRRGGQRKRQPRVAWSRAADLAFLRALKRMQPFGGATSERKYRWQEVARVVASATHNPQFDIQRCVSRYYILVRNFLPRRSALPARAAPEDVERYELLRGEHDAYMKRKKAKGKRQPVLPEQDDEMDMDMEIEAVNSDVAPPTSTQVHRCGKWIKWFRSVISILTELGIVDPFTGPLGERNKKWSSVARSAGLKVARVKYIYQRTMEIFAQYQEALIQDADLGAFWFMDPQKYSVDDPTASDALAQYVETFKHFAHASFEKYRKRDEAKRDEFIKYGKASNEARFELLWREYVAVLRAYLRHPDAWDQIAVAVDADTRGWSRLSASGCKDCFDKVMKAPFYYTEAKVTNSDNPKYWDPAYERERLKYKVAKTLNITPKFRKTRPGRGDQDQDNIDAYEFIHDVDMPHENQEDGRSSYEVEAPQDDGATDSRERAVDMEVDSSSGRAGDDEQAEESGDHSLVETGMEQDDEGDGFSYEADALPDRDRGANRGEHAVEMHGHQSCSEQARDSRDETEDDEDFPMASYPTEIAPPLPASSVTQRKASTASTLSASDVNAPALRRDRVVNTQQPTSSEGTSSQLEEGAHQLGIQGSADLQEEASTRRSTLDAFRQDQARLRDESRRDSRSTADALEQHLTRIAELNTRTKEHAEWIEQLREEVATARSRPVQATAELTALATRQQELTGLVDQVREEFERRVAVLQEQTAAIGAAVNVSQAETERILQAEATVAAQIRDNNDKLKALFATEYVSVVVFDASRQAQTTAIESIRQKSQQVITVCRDEFKHLKETHQKQTVDAKSHRQVTAELRQTQSAMGEEFRNHRDQTTTRLDDTVSKLDSLWNDQEGLKCTVEAQGAQLQRVEGRLEVLERTRSQPDETQEPSDALERTQRELAELRQQNTEQEERVRELENRSLPPEVVEQICNEYQQRQLYAKQQELQRKQQNQSTPPQAEDMLY